MNRNLEERLQDLIRVSHKAYEKGFTGGSGGNVSIRCGEKFYISCTGSFLGSLTEEDFTCIDMNGAVIKGRKPSKEFIMHLECYKKRPDIQCIFHLHPLYSIAATCRQEIDYSCGLPVYTPGYALRVNKIPIIPYFMPGSLKLAQEVARLLENQNCVLLKNHGVVAVGREPEAVFGIAEEIEENAHITMILGNGGYPMTQEQIQEIRDAGGIYGK